MPSPLAVSPPRIPRRWNPSPNPKMKIMTYSMAFTSENGRIEASLQKQIGTDELATAKLSIARGKSNEARLY